MNKRIIVLLTGVLAIALVAVGCGGGGSEEEGTTTTGPLTKAEFVKKGNAICKQGNEEIEAGFGEFAKKNNLSEKSPPSEEQSAEAAETILIPRIHKDIAEIRALGLPKEDSKGAEGALDAAEAALKEAEKDPVAFIESEGESDAFKKANKMAREFGLTVCGEQE